MESQQETNHIFAHLTWWHATYAPPGSSIFTAKSPKAHFTCAQKWNWFCIQGGGGGTHLFLLDNIGRFFIDIFGIWYSRSILKQKSCLSVHEWAKRYTKTGFLNKPHNFYFVIWSRNIVLCECQTLPNVTWTLFMTFIMSFSLKVFRSGHKIYTYYFLIWMKGYRLHIAFLKFGLHSLSKFWCYKHNCVREPPIENYTILILVTRFSSNLRLFWSYLF